MTSEPVAPRLDGKSIRLDGITKSFGATRYDEADARPLAG